MMGNSDVQVVELIYYNFTNTR